MTNKSFVDECHSFGTLRKALRQDLTIWHGFSNQEAGQILNYFDPSLPEYLEHVDTWQKALCSGCISHPLLSVYKRNGFGNYDIFQASADSVGAIHQVCKLFYKWHGIPRKETNMSEVKDRLRNPLPIKLDDFEIRGIRKILSRFKAPDLESLIGRFGPGATADRFNSWHKWKRLGLIPDIPPSLFRVNSRDPITFTVNTYGGVTRIAEVPKSIKSNRIVSSEPAMFMFAQLALADDLEDQLVKLFPGHTFLHDQETHSLLLRDNDACSIDLSDASDHISVELVRTLLPQLWPVLATVRSSYACFPDGEEVPLGTFAPMGSGLCFIVMTIILCGILEFAKNVTQAETGFNCFWRTYGDDQIVHWRMYDYVISLEIRSGLVPNLQKSCCTRVYREACGRELFFSQDITPAYIRDPIDLAPAEKIEQIAEGLNRRFFPNTAAEILSASNCIRGYRWNRNLQMMEVCVRTYASRQKVRNLDDWDGLMRWFCVHTKGNTLNERKPTGATAEVWTKACWRYKPAFNYPTLWAWFVTPPPSRAK